MALSNGSIAAIATAGGLGMLGLAFAADPLYDTFCQVTGFGGTTRIATQGPSEILDRTIDIRFDANVADAPLLFRALQATQTVRIGQHGLAFYEVTNPTQQEVRVIASYNVTPHYAGPYFNKLECFCFSERVIAPGESRKLPVVYFVSPNLVEDRISGQLETITLSYTFFDSSAYSGRVNQAAAPAAPEGAANSAAPG
ncbi:MAG: cytochrome c oxidase assembly protein [Hyphomonas sp.]|nr:cytochrome c oxidase assembly protein [Hyphomonas sp.]